MRAICVQAFGGPEQLVLKELPMPAAGPGEVLIRVRALGINRAETYFRRGLWGDVSRVSGIECVGQVEDDPSGRLANGQTVAAIMGGLGRSRNGSYAEFTVAPASNVIPIETSLSWAALAAIPESYATAWSAVVDHIQLRSGQTLLVRGATAALGQAAINVAHQLGARVLATTRRPERETMLRSIGADEVLIDAPNLSAPVRQLHASGIDGVLDLLGNATFQDSLRMVRRHGVVCVAGFLGGSEPVSVDVLSGLAPGASLCFFASFLLGTPGYPVTAIPMQQMVARVERGAYRAAPAHVFRLEEMPDAHRLMESNEAAGKLVVVVE